MSKYYTEGDVIEVKIEKIVPRGFGLAFAENLTILVPLTAPGDLVNVRIREIKKRMAFAEIVDIIDPGPKRISPPCQHFGVCGGCDFQQMDYTAQLEAKAGIVRDCLHRIGKIEYEGDIPVIPSPNQFGYRSRARWHLDPQKQTLGYFQRDSHEVVDVAVCPILTPGMLSTLDYLRLSLNWGTFWTETPQIEAATGEGERVSIFSRELPEPAAEISIDLGGETYAYTAETFFQANRFLIEKLIETAIGDATGGNAFDLYCGVGLFALPLARRFNKVIGVEEDPGAIALGKTNAKNAGLQNLDLINKSVEAFLSTNKTQKIDLAVIDPPRAGTEKGVIQRLAALKPERISYVSCEPSILARDLRILLDAGFVIDAITALDLFPQTHHIETVVRLHK
ncbi:MAG: class I SAM-dependent RNA methyltransferase [Pyrinomonadaceae bacterium]